ncbi:MAG: hypothetical protein KDK36_07960 [Leptospiraceae bacterium]|nr:hypothetical protein [Leptospiraceae bacterium]
MKNYLFYFVSLILAIFCSNVHSQGVKLDEEIKSIKESLKKIEEKVDTIPTPTILLVAPFEKQNIKVDTDFYIFWELQNYNKDQETRDALIILVREYGLKLDTIGKVQLSKKKFLWKVSDTIVGNNSCRIKIEPTLKELKPSESKTFTLVGESEYYFSVSTGINFNYAADTKLSGLYFAATASFPQLVVTNFLGIKRFGIDLYLGQGLIKYNEENTNSTTDVRSPIISSSVTQSLNITNLYPSASLIWSFTKNLELVLPHAEFIRSSKTLTTNSESTISRKSQIDSTKDTIINNSFSSIENRIDFKSFLGGGLGFRFGSKLFIANAKIILGYDWFSEGWGTLVRYSLKYGQSPSVSIGGTIFGAFKDFSPATLYQIYNNEGTEAMVYGAIDIDLNQLKKLFGL